MIGGELQRRSDYTSSSKKYKSRIKETKTSQKCRELSCYLIATRYLNAAIGFHKHAPLSSTCSDAMVASPP